MKRSAMRAVVAYAVASGALFVLQTIRPGGWPFSALPATFVDFLGFVGMLSPLVLGTLEAVFVVRKLEPDNRARPAWMLLAAALGGFSTGEAALGAYRYVALVRPPTPSAGDAMFLLGYAMLVAAALWFVRVYATSGFPLGSARRPWMLAGSVALAVVVVGGPLLAPMFHAGRPAAEAFVALAYPILDFVLLVVTALLLGITLQFRGGRVWIVWAYILSGLFMTSVADVLFAYLDLAGMGWVDPLLSSTFIAGYTLTAVGIHTQARLLSE